MALYKCPECGHIISDRADACPNCGYVLKTYTNPNNNANNRHNITIILAVIALIAALALIGILLYKSNSANNSETSASTETIVQDSAVVNDSVIGQATRQASYEKTSILNGNVFTMVYTTSDDGFLNIRSKPSMEGVVLGEINESYNGLGDGVLVKKGAKWSKVRKGNVEGWVSNKYLGGTIRNTGSFAGLTEEEAEKAKAFDDDLKAVATAAYGKVEKKMDDLRAADALTEIFTVFKRLNVRLSYLD